MQNKHSIVLLTLLFFFNIQAFAIDSFEAPRSGIKAKISNYFPSMLNKLHLKEDTIIKDGPIETIALLKVGALQLFLFIKRALLKAI